MLDYQKEFENIVNRDIHRPGIEPLMDYIRSSDFFIAPASTKHHDSHPGGLVKHSVEVYHALLGLESFLDSDEQYDLESTAIVSLFHDICKIGCYKVETRWRKDEKNKWESYSTYKFEEDFAYGGHGSKSVFLIQSFMHLTPEEASAINCHMGQWDSSAYSNPSSVYERNALAWLLHVADEAVTYDVIKYKGAQL